MRISVILPAKNEAHSLSKLLGDLHKQLPAAEIIVVDDGSSDDTASVAEAGGARVIRHRYSMGNGAAIKTGARNALGEVLVFMDADSQHAPADIRVLLAALDEGFDLAIGTRSGQAHASFARRLANSIYNRLASWITGHEIRDLTSGFRAVRASMFRQFLSLLPNGFSYPTTSTMAFLRAGYGVIFVPVHVRARASGTQSHIRPLRDGGRFLLIIFKVGTLFSPLKIFAPVSATLFAVGCWYYAYTFITSGRFTNAGVLLITTSILTFLIGLVSEQITQLLYARLESGSEDPRR